MSAFDEILGALPIDQLAQQVGAQPDEVQQAASAVLPALLGGLQANAGDPRGASSILDALGQHNDDLLDGGVDLSQVDQSDGEKIASHIFGSNQDAVINQLGGVGGGASSGLIRRLLPILAPIVLSWLAKQVMGGMQGGGATQGGAALPQQGGQSQSTPGGPGSLEDMLQDVLGGALGGAGGATAGSAPQQGGGGILGDILGGLLGGGRR